MKIDPLNIVIAGVGGQGNILASRLIAETAVAAGLKATIGEIFGASQRGGAVSSHVRISKKMNYAPLIPGGGAHLILAFEPLEACRVARQYAGSDCVGIINPRKSLPIGVLTGAFNYPADDQWHSELFELLGSVHIIPATDLAIEAGSSQATNMVMVGAFAAFDLVPIAAAKFTEQIEAAFGPEKGATNLKAFRSGYDHMRKLDDDDED